MGQVFTSIPSPANNVWNLGPFPIRFYAVMILAGIFTAIWFGNKRWIARGGVDGDVADVALWAVPCGVIGGRLYHVLTDWATYFGTGGRGFSSSLKIWEGGLGIWGAVALGALGAYIGCARKGIAFAPFADAIAPALVFAQAIGRWGNWFNQELFGRPTSVAWGLHIDMSHRPVEYIQYSTFHPTFLYESLACLIIGLIVIKADSTYLMGHGRVFALYVTLYCAARGGIETLRVDQAHTIFGIRLNVFTAVVLGFLALTYLVVIGERKQGREVLLDGKYASPEQIESRKRDIEAETTSETSAEANVHVAVDFEEEGEPELAVAPAAPVLLVTSSAEELDKNLLSLVQADHATDTLTQSDEIVREPGAQEYIVPRHGASRARRAKPKGS